MRTAVVITTIRGPKSVENWMPKYDHDPDLIVIGDQKTPDVEWGNFNRDRVTYLSFPQQQRRWPELANMIPANHYARKMLGYLFAKENGFTHVFETDDDNHPLTTGWYGFVSTQLDRAYHWAAGTTFNPYEYFSEVSPCGIMWPRGMMPGDVMLKNALVPQSSNKHMYAPVIQFMHDDTPDFDAVGHMLTQGVSHIFSKFKQPVRLSVGAWSTFNSQATFWDLSYIDLMYLPVTCTHRFTDILRAWLCFEQLWKRNCTVAYAGSVVRQDRNAHDLIADVLQEIPMYKTVSLARELFGSDIKICLNQCQEWGIISEKEKEVWDAWVTLVRPSV